MNTLNQKRLLNLRKQQERMAEIRVQQKSLSVEATKQQIADQEARIKCLHSDKNLNRVSARLQLSSLVLIIRSALDELHRKLKEQHKELVVEQQALAQARIAAEALSYLQDKWIAKRDADLARRDQLGLDDIVSRTWMKNRQQDV